ncbi:unnamed protein product, partial [Effrenium voratum]
AFGLKKLHRRPWPMDTHQAILSSANAFRHSCLHGRWSDAREAAVSLALTAASAAEATDSCSEVEEMEGFTDTRKTDALWVAASSARAGLLKMLAAFSARAARGPSRDLALATAAACTAMLPEVWPSGSADDLLSMSGVPGLLLRAVALVSRATPGLGGFATLRACRAAAELFAALLEASMPELRQACEAALFRDSSLSSPMHSIAEALLGSNPDPRLNEAILEILWRGLRRVPFGAALAALSSAHPALVCLEDRQVGLCSNLQKLSADQLLVGSGQLPRATSAARCAWRRGQESFCGLDLLHGIWAWAFSFPKDLAKTLDDLTMQIERMQAQLQEARHESFRPPPPPESTPPPELLVDAPISASTLNTGLPGCMEEEEEEEEDEEDTPDIVTNGSATQPFE